MLRPKSENKCTPKITILWAINHNSKLHYELEWIINSRYKQHWFPNGGLYCGSKLIPRLMNNLTVSHYYFYSTFPPKCSQCNIILYFTKVIIISNTFDRHEIVSIWVVPKPFLCSVWLGGTKSRALLLQTDVHLCVLSSQWLSVSSFVWASHALHWKVTSCTHNFTMMLNLTLPVQIKWSRSHFDCWRNLLSAGRAY